MHDQQNNRQNGHCSSEKVYGTNMANKTKLTGKMSHCSFEKVSGTCRANKPCFRSTTVLPFVIM